MFRGRKIITDLTYNENEHPGETEYEGGVVFDLLCTGDAGEHFLIEVQRSKQKHFRERALFYTSKLIVAQAPKGKRSEWKYISMKYTWWPCWKISSIEYLCKRRG